MSAPAARFPLFPCHDIPRGHKARRAVAAPARTSAAQITHLFCARGTRLSKPPAASFPRPALPAYI